MQGEGTFYGEEFYFRARYDAWSISVGGDDVVLAPDWYYEEPFGAGFDAGYMSLAKARICIEEAYEAYELWLSSR